LAQHELEVDVPIDHHEVAATLSIPDHAHALVLFAHGSGSSRFSPRNRYVADVLRDAGLATLRVDLLTVDEERIDSVTSRYRFDIPLLASRLKAATDWVETTDPLRAMKLGYFGASTGGAAALIAAAHRASSIGAIVCRGGRPELAEAALPQVSAPTLLIVGEADHPVLERNQAALERLGSAHKELRVVAGASHLFEEAGALQEVAELTAAWFSEFLRPDLRSDAPAVAW
jgi:putative phosphoribosyl transferase